LKATAICVSSKGTKLMLALIEVPRRKKALTLTLLEEAEEEDAAMELNSKELVEIVANKVTKRVVAGRRKKMPTKDPQDIEYQVKVVTPQSIVGATKSNTYCVLLLFGLTTVNFYWIQTS
jgi:hypothetical protein